MNHYTDALIVTRNILSDTQINQVASQARNIDGIEQFMRSKKIPRLIWVSYHTGKTGARAILNQFNKFGHHASIIDM